MSTLGGCLLPLRRHTAVPVGSMQGQEARKNQLGLETGVPQLWFFLVFSQEKVAQE